MMIPRPTDNALTCGNVSGHSIIMVAHVTSNRHGGAATTPIGPIPHGRVSPDSPCRTIRVPGDHARPSGDAHTLMRYAARPAPGPAAGAGPRLRWSTRPRLKTSPVAGPRGFDGANKVDGVKRHILVDSAGMLVAVVGHRGQHGQPGSLPETAAPRQADRIDDQPRSPRQLPRPGSPWTSCPGQNPPTDSTSNRGDGLLKAQTGGSTTADDSTATTKSPLSPTKGSPSSARSPYSYTDLTAASCSTRVSDPAQLRCMSRCLIWAR